MLLILNSLRASLADELDQFFQALHRLDVAVRHVTPGALSRARRKLSHPVFQRLLDVVTASVDAHAPLRTFRGLRVFAIDGSTMKLPDTLCMREQFGFQKNRFGLRAMGRVTILHDVLNRITYDAILGSFHSGEIAMMWQHLEQVALPSQSLILLDRGFYDFAALKTIRDNGFHFCIRLRSNLGIYKTFMKQGVDDLCLTLRPPKRSRGFHPRDPFLSSFPVRLVRYRVKGQVYVLMTTLSNDKRFTSADLSDLYHLRWQVEESFKVKKCRLEIEQLSGKEPKIVLQDFYARVLKECLTMSLLLEAEQRVAEKTRHRKHRYKPCVTQALAKMKHTLALLFLRKNPAGLIRELLAIFSSSLVSVEPGRCYERNTRANFAAKMQTFSFAYRPCR